MQEYSSRKGPGRAVSARYFPLLVILVIALLLFTSAIIISPGRGEEAAADNEPPVADAGADYSDVLLNEVHMLDGSNSTDEDIENCTWLWECTSHTGVEIQDSDSPVAFYTVFTEEPIVFRLTVTDPEGLWDTDEIRVTPAINNDPVLDTLSILPADSGPEGPFYEIGTPVEFNATSVTDAESSLEELSFSWSSDVPGEGAFPAEPAFFRKMNILGWHNITLAVSDPNGGHSELVKRIYVREDPLPPTASFTIWPIRSVYDKGEKITLDASATSDPNSFDTLETMNFTWSTNLTGGRVLGYGCTLDISAEEGDQNISLEVTDADGLRSTAWEHLLVVNQPPSAVITTPGMGERNGVRTVNVSQTASLSGWMSSDPNGDRLEYLWDLGDGSRAAGVNITHAWTVHGTYNVTLEVDDGSMKDSTASTVTRIDVNTIPEAVIEYVRELTVGEPYRFSANGSGDEDGDHLTYRWDFDGDGIFDQTGFNTTYTFDEEGTFEVLLRVDDGFAWSEASVEVEVAIPNDPPIARIVGYEEGDDPIIVPLDDNVGDVELDASVSIDPDDDINNNGVIDGKERNNLTFSWDIDAGKDGPDDDQIPDNDFTRKGRVLRMSIEDDRILRVRLNVTDRGGLSSYLLIELKGDNPPEVLEIKTSKQYKLYVNSTVEFTCTADDQDSGQTRNLKYTWNFGDGSVVENVSSSYSHKYRDAGTYEVTARVFDGYLWGEGRTTITVVEFDGLDIRFPRDGSVLSGRVKLRGTVDYLVAYRIDEVYVKVDNGEWMRASNPPDWEYDLDTLGYPDGPHTIHVKVVLDTGVEQELSVDVTIQNSEVKDNTGLITGIIIIVIVLAVIGLLSYLLFGKRRRRSRDLLYSMPPPPGAGPGIPSIPQTGIPPGAGGIAAVPPGPSPEAGGGPPALETPAPEEEERKRNIRVKCPACGKMFRAEDTGERPLELTCTHCGAKGSIARIPGDEDREKDGGGEAPEEEEPEPEPVPIICPSCSGLFELSEVAEQAKCPFCGAVGDLDEETMATLEERFGEPKEKEITVRCPSCQGKFSIKSTDTEIICPFCGVSGNVPKGS